MSPTNDIPEAQRDSPLNAPKSLLRRGWSRWLGWFLVGLLSATAGLIASWATYEGTAQPVLFQEAVGSPSLGVAAPPAPGREGQGDSLLGHLAYAEAPPEDLVSLPSASDIRLRSVAADAFEAMRAAAEAARVYLLPLSGFRSVEDQQFLFFGVKAQRGQDTRQRAEVSAPPGYSEHHTGYAIDVGDANYPDAHLEVAFERTPTFQWMAQNATRYSFELSFPEGNEQGVAYEPWHWRYVGDSDSLKTFYQGR